MTGHTTVYRLLLLSVLTLANVYDYKQQSTDYFCCLQVRLWLTGYATAAVANSYAIVLL